MLLWSIEARVATARRVVYGSISRVSRTVLSDGQTRYELTLQAKETLKGGLPGPSDGLSRQVPYEDRRYEEWAAARTPCLFFVGNTHERGGEREWSVTPLGDPVPSESGFTPRLRAPMFSHDFSILEKDADVLGRARKFARRFPKPLPIQRLRIPNAMARQVGPNGSWNDLRVPVEPSLEGRARRLITQPGDFMPAGTELDARSRYELRASGVDALRHFRSRENAALLRGLLNDAPEKFHSDLVEPPIRVRAFVTLLHWGAETPLPGWPEQITRLALSGTNVGDEGLKQVALLDNLTALELRNTRITPLGLKELRRLKRLTHLGLDEPQLSDAALRALRAGGQLHTLSQATTDAGNAANSLEEVNALSLPRSPITDAGLNELTGIKRLTWLDLRETRISDAGLRTLATFSHLRRLLLQDTRVTRSGVAALQRALPECEIGVSQ